MGNPVVYFEISSKDYQQLQSFYARPSAWKLTPFGDQPYASVDTGEPPRRRHRSAAGGLS